MFCNKDGNILWQYSTFDMVKEVVVEQLHINPDIIIWMAKSKKPRTVFNPNEKGEVSIEELIGKLESQYNIEIPHDYEEDIATVADAIEFIENMNKKG